METNSKEEVWTAATGSAAARQVFSALTGDELKFKLGSDMLRRIWLRESERRGKVTLIRKGRRAKLVSP